MNDLSFPDNTTWRKLAHHEPLAVLVDLDGTLINFAPTPEQATIDPSAKRLLQSLLDTGVYAVVVSGRPRAAIEPFLGSLPNVWWFAEHGVWHNADGRWIGPASADAELDDLAQTLRGLATVPGTRLERKSMSVCLHWRLVDPARRPALVAAAELACDEWLETHLEFERLHGVELVEVRRRTGHKGHAVRFVRGRVDGVRIVAIGDDVTDEDMFAELRDGDAGIAVGHDCRQSRAHARLIGPIAVRAFLHWLAESRRGNAIQAPPLTPIVELRMPRERASLLVMSNRTPAPPGGRHREVGGLVSALEPALRDRRGMWLGWSGQEHDGANTLVIDGIAQPPRASFDLTSTSRDRFYAGFCNRVLWPLFHGFPSRVTYNDVDWEAYVAANSTYARHATDVAHPDAAIWVHDYHLLLAARELRRRGHRGRIGLFLHVPFPSRDLFDTIPWRDDLLDAMLDFDLIGFHTERWLGHFLDAARTNPAITVASGLVSDQRRSTAVGCFPIPIDAGAFSTWSDDSADVAGLRAALGERRLLLGVDRLDYAKGIPERLLAFERLLEQFPHWRGRISFVQVSVPSRAEIPDYAELKQRVETLVGRINGKYGEADWVPVRYLYRSYDHLTLAQLYRLADVALVTPLRDGMNLVAKEFVAAQDDGAPGVLVLSRFAGAADELADALLTNPFHPDGLAADIDRALRMPAAERIARQLRLRDALDRGGTPRAWASAFLARLAAPIAGSVVARQLVDEELDHPRGLGDHAGLGAR